MDFPKGLLHLQLAVFWCEKPWNLKRQSLGWHLLQACNVACSVHPLLLLKPIPLSRNLPCCWFRNLNMNVGTLTFPLTHTVTLNEWGVEVSSPESHHPPDNYPPSPIILSSSNHVLKAIITSVFSPIIIAQNLRATETICNICSQLESFQRWHVLGCHGVWKYIGFSSAGVVFQHPVWRIVGRNSGPCQEKRGWRAPHGLPRTSFWRAIRPEQESRKGPLLPDGLLCSRSDYPTVFSISCFFSNHVFYLDRKWQQSLCDLFATACMQLCTTLRCWSWWPVGRKGREEQGRRVEISKTTQCSPVQIK